MAVSRSLDFASIAVLRSFVAVVEAGGFSQAAKQRGTTSSTMSKHVASLEAGLKMALLHRTTRRLEVTRPGQRFYECCKAILHEVDQAGVIAHPDSDLTGELRVMASPSFTASVLMPRLPGFLAAHPQLAVELRVSSVHADLIREGIDVCISLTDDQPNKSPAIKLARNPCVVCASPEYLQRHGTPATPAELAQHAGLAAIGAPYGDEWPFLVGRTIKRYPVRKVFTSDNGEVLRACCLAGHGLCGFYAFHVADDIRAGRLVEVLASYRADPGAVLALVPHRHYLSPAARAFIAFVRELCEAFDLDR